MERLRRSINIPENNSIQIFKSILVSKNFFYLLIFDIFFIGMFLICFKFSDFYLFYLLQQFFFFFFNMWLPKFVFTGLQSCCSFLVQQVLTYTTTLTLIQIFFFISISYSWSGLSSGYFFFNRIMPNFTINANVDAILYILNTHFHNTDFFITYKKKKNLFALTSFIVAENTFSEPVNPYEDIFEIDDRGKSLENQQTSVEDLTLDNSYWVVNSISTIWLGFCFCCVLFFFSLFNISFGLLLWFCLIGIVIEFYIQIGLAEMSTLAQFREKMKFRLELVAEVLQQTEEYSEEEALEVRQAYVKFSEAYELYKKKKKKENNAFFEGDEEPLENGENDDLNITDVEVDLFSDLTKTRSVPELNTSNENQFYSSNIIKLLKYKNELFERQAESEKLDAEWRIWVSGITQVFNTHLRPILDTYINARKFKINSFFFKTYQKRILRYKKSYFSFDTNTELMFIVFCFKFSWGFLKWLKIQFILFLKYLYKLLLQYKIMYIFFRIIIRGLFIIIFYICKQSFLFFWFLCTTNIKFRNVSYRIFRLIILQLFYFSFFFFSIFYLIFWRFFTLKKLSTYKKSLQYFCNFLFNFGLHYFNNKKKFFKYRKELNYVFFFNKFFYGIYFLLQEIVARFFPKITQEMYSYLEIPLVQSAVLRESLRRQRIKNPDVSEYSEIDPRVMYTTKINFIFYCYMGYIFCCLILLLSFSQFFLTPALFFSFLSQFNEESLFLLGVCTLSTELNLITTWFASSDYSTHEQITQPVITYNNTYDAFVNMGKENVELQKLLLTGMRPPLSREEQLLYTVPEDFTDIWLETAVFVFEDQLIGLFESVEPIRLELELYDDVYLDTMGFIQEEEYPLAVWNNYLQIPPQRYPMVVDFDFNIFESEYTPLEYRDPESWSDWEVEYDEEIDIDSVIDAGGEYDVDEPEIEVIEIYDEDYAHDMMLVSDLHPSFPCLDDKVQNAIDPNELGTVAYYPTGVGYLAHLQQQQEQILQSYFPACLHPAISVLLNSPSFLWQLSYFGDFGQNAESSLITLQQLLKAQPLNKDSWLLLNQAFLSEENLYGNLYVDFRRSLHDLIFYELHYSHPDYEEFNYPGVFYYGENPLDPRVESEDFWYTAVLSTPVEQKEFLDFTRHLLLPEYQSVLDDSDFRWMQKQLELANYDKFILELFEYCIYPGLFEKSLYERYALSVVLEYYHWICELLQIFYRYYFQLIKPIISGTLKIFFWLKGKFTL